MRRYTADTLALLVFSTVGALFTEIVIAGLSPGQSAHARLTAIPVILATARPYGLYRDRLMRGLRAGDAATRLRRTAADTLAFLSFQLPIYWTILALAGASLRQIAVSSVAATALILVSGRPYGILLDLCRRLAGPDPEAGRRLLRPGWRERARRALTAARPHRAVGDSALRILGS